MIDNLINFGILAVLATFFSFIFEVYASDDKDKTGNKVYSVFTYICFCATSTLFVGFLLGDEYDREYLLDDGVTIICLIVSFIACCYVVCMPFVAISKVRNQIRLRKLNTKLNMLQRNIRSCKNDIYRMNSEISNWESILVFLNLLDLCGSDVSKIKYNSEILRVSELSNKIAQKEQEVIRLRQELNSLQQQS